jgi:DNA-binding MarR family transcriptional regulator
MTPSPTYQVRPSPKPARMDNRPAQHPASDGERRPAPAPLPRPPRLTRQTVTVLQALHLNPAAAHDLRYLTARTGLPRPTIRSILDRLNRCQWTSVEQDPTDSARARPRHLYRLTDSGARVSAGHLDRDKTTAVFRWDHPRSPRIVATSGDLDLVLVATARHAAALPAVPWPMVEVTDSPSHSPTLWYATTRHRGVLLWPDPATGTILTAHHPDVPLAPAPIAFTTPGGQPRTLDSRYTQLRAQDVRTALQRWWCTRTQPGLAFRPTPLRIPPCSR